MSWNFIRRVCIKVTARRGLSCAMWVAMSSRALSTKLENSSHTVIPLCSQRQRSLGIYALDGRALRRPRRLESGRGAPRATDHGAPRLLVGAGCVCASIHAARRALLRWWDA